MTAKNIAPVSGNVVRSPEEIALLKQFHEQGMEDLIYRDGYNSETDECPHEFPQELNDAILKLSCKKGPLYEFEKELLKELNWKFNSTPWQRWKKGHHRRMNPIEGVNK